MTNTFDRLKDREGHPLRREDFAFSVNFPDLVGTDKYPLTLMRAELQKKPSEHDILTLLFRGSTNNRLKLLESGDKVEFVYRNADFRQTWVGYVHHLKPTTIDGKVFTRVVCIGATYPLKATQKKVYKNVTADQVISKIAAEYGLKADTQRHPRKHKTISNAGQTKWQLMRRLAAQTGFALVPENTTIHFMSKDQLYKDSLAKNLVFGFLGGETTSLFRYQTIFDFTPTITDESPDMPGAAVTRAVSGIHDNDGSVIESTHTSTLSSYSGPGIKGATDAV